MHGGLICLLVLASAQWCYGSSRLEEWEVTLHHNINKHHGGQPIVDPPRHSAGYMNLKNTHGARLFYYYAQDRYKNPYAPLVFWTNGGPGSSAMRGAFGLYGPFDITEDLKLKYSGFGWDLGQNLLFVDQPVGVGFSYSTDPRDAVHWEETVGEDMLAFFLEFMELHPELQGNQLYLAGISYAGHYVPSIARAVLESNWEGKNMHLNLAGVLLGNPSMHALYEYAYMPTYAYENRLISKDLYIKLMASISTCQRSSMICNWKDTLDLNQYNRCVDAQRHCNLMIRDPIVVENPGLNPMDISIINSQVDSSDQGKEEEEESPTQKYLNLPEVQKQLGVHKKWKSENNTVFVNMEGDMMRDMTGDIVTLLNNGIRFMVFSGDRDLIVNWLGTKEMFAEMQWGSSPYWKNELRLWGINLADWIQDSSGIVTAGACEVLEPLTNCVIFNEGHTVSSANAYITMKTFVTGGLFVVSDPVPSLLEPESSSKGIFAAT